MGRRGSERRATTHSVLVRLESGLAKALADRCDGHGMSRPEFIRRVVQHALQADETPKAQKTARRCVSRWSDQDRVLLATVATTSGRLAGSLIQAAKAARVPAGEGEDVRAEIEGILSEVTACLATLNHLLRAQEP